MINLIPDVSKALYWLKTHPDALKGIKRGLERETLRVLPNGYLPTTKHPVSFGSPLTHKWITTDFAETLLEFITPVNDDIEKLLTFLHDIHRYVSQKLGEELMWPMSMPCMIDNVNNIELAQYGSSNIGKMKNLYRKGLKKRYGSLMQMISGVHYNFSLPLSFWQQWTGIKNAKSGKKIISDGYLRLIRNYYRFGWIIPYLFGASPAICSSFFQKKENIPPLSFEYHDKGMLCLPYATSLRISDLGYTNKTQSHLHITFNNLDEYIKDLKKAIQTPSKEFSDLGLKDKNGNFLQLNTNLLQIENEFYAPIRPKRISPHNNEAPSNALMRDGIEYIEVRSLDINPFSPIGINRTQIYFLDLFLIWCAMADSPDISHLEFITIRKNWNKIILEGRKPGQTIKIRCKDEYKIYSLVDIGKALFRDLNQFAKNLDHHSGHKHSYEEVCNSLVMLFENPDLTYSARFLKILKEKNGICSTGIFLSKYYQQQLNKESLELLTEKKFIDEALRSKFQQKEIEKNDNVSFDNFLQNYI